MTTGASLKHIWNCLSSRLLKNHVSKSAAFVMLCWYSLHLDRLFQMLLISTTDRSSFKLLQQWISLCMCVCVFVYMYISCSHIQSCVCVYVLSDTKRGSYATQFLTTQSLTRWTDSSTRLNDFLSTRKIKSENNFIKSSFLISRTSDNIFIIVWNVTTQNRWRFFRLQHKTYNNIQLARFECSK